MKCISTLVTAAALAAMAAAPATAEQDAAPSFDLDRAFAGAAPAVETLDTRAMEETRGRLPLLAIPLAIAGVDIGLMGLYWGVYVPNYAGGSICNNCNTLQNH